MTSCFSGVGSSDSNGLYAGQQDAIYDHDNNLAYNPTPQCCHPAYWDNQFTQGYDHQWNQYRTQNTDQRTSVNINGNDNVVNLGQTSNQNQDQNQGPSMSDTGCGDQCGDSGPCSGACNGLAAGPCDFGCGFHHFGFWHFHHFWHEGCGFGCDGYRHTGFGGEGLDP